MTSLADFLPPEFAAQVSPEWRANERAYWAARDAVLAEYAGQWIAFADGRVVAAGRRPVVVPHAAARISKHPFSSGSVRPPTRPGCGAPEGCRRVLGGFLI